MKSTTALAAGLIAAALTLASPTLAGDDAQIDDLKEAKARVAKAANFDKPGHAQGLRRQAYTLQNLIDQLEAGQKVDPAEIDRALKEAETAR